jgi:hypothetical protein
MNIKKVFKKIVLKVMKNIKKDNMGIKKLMFEYVCENQISYFKINKNEMISWTIYMIVDYQVLVTNRYLNNLKIYQYFDLVSIDRHR